MVKNKEKKHKLRPFKSDLLNSFRNKKVSNPRTFKG